MQIIKIKTITVWNNTGNQIQHCTTYTAFKKPDPTQICPLLYNFPCKVLKMHYFGDGTVSKKLHVLKTFSLSRVVSLHENTENWIIYLQGLALGPKTLGPQHTMWSPRTGQVFLRQISENVVVLTSLGAPCGSEAASVWSALQTSPFTLGISKPGQQCPAFHPLLSTPSPPALPALTEGSGRCCKYCCTPREEGV